jgi:bifunctional non-homologous end joining protein LigD
VLVQRDPGHLTQEFIKADREGRILVDTGRNGYGATFAAAYAVRPRPGAPVSAPCTWAELEENVVRPQTFGLRTMADRLARVGDLWAELHANKQSLARPIEQLRAMLTAEDWSQALAASTRKPRARKAPRRRSSQT